MKKYHVFGVVEATKYLGVVEAEDAEQAKELGLELDSCCVSVCHQCSRDVEDPEIHTVMVNEANDEDV